MLNPLQRLKSFYASFALLRGQYKTGIDIAAQITAARIEKIAEKAVKTNFAERLNEPVIKRVPLVYPTFRDSLFHSSPPAHRLFEKALPAFVSAIAKKYADEGLRMIFYWETADWMVIKNNKLYLRFTPCEKAAHKVQPVPAAPLQAPVQTTIPPEPAVPESAAAASPAAETQQELLHRIARVRQERSPHQEI